MPIRNLLRAAFSLAVGAAYALPLTVGIASQVGHELDHYLDELRGVEPATAQGVVGVSGTGQGFVHAHGEVDAHAHEGGVGKLLVAAEHTEQQQSDAVVVALELVGHVPSASASVLHFAANAARTWPAPAASASAVTLRPPLPPPRA